MILKINFANSREIKCLLKTSYYLLIFSGKKNKLYSFKGNSLSGEKI